MNLSARQAARPTLSDGVLGVIAASGLPAEALCLEITETALLAAGPSTLRQLTALRDAGVQIGIDDFGTGYASLRYLRELPVSFLKIDRSFVAGLPDDAEDRTIVVAVANLARDLGLDCVVEGVETAEQLAAVRTLSARTGQGYFFSRPCPAEKLETLFGLPLPLALPDLPDLPAQPLPPAQRISG